MQTQSDSRTLDQIRDFISQHELAVVSTVGPDGRPEAAVVGFSEGEDFSILFGTFASSQKYANLKKDGHVALVIGWDMGKTVQIDGVATEVTDEAELDEIKRVHFAKIPTAVKYVAEGEGRFFRVAPSRVRYSNWTMDPPEVQEIRI